MYSELKKGVHGYPKAEQKLKLNFWLKLNGRNARIRKTFAWWMLSTFCGISSRKKNISLCPETVPRMFRPRKSVQEGKFVKNSVDCSQSAIFSWDRLDIPRLTVTAILFFKCTEGAGVRDYSSGAGGIGWGRDSRFLPNHPRPLSSFDTHARWQPVTQSAQSRWSYGKIEDCEQSKNSVRSILNE